ncbi:hypothetical protein [Bacteroides thetaiotaomicron]|uniref:hypothetical protein n=1 Tax=Bacteroides thetaiotaomicron TaxID=818 RepID=UPI001929A45F|nr:hypothetical protein [Bacteroides thetaiotaomicron]
MWSSARRPGRTVFGITGQKVTPSGCFPAGCLASTMAASRHPDHRPGVTPVFRSSCGLRLRRSRLTASALRRAENLRRSASPSAPESGAKRPAEK